MNQRTFWTYILSSRSRNLYVGVTNDVVVRVHQHKTKALGGFSARYNIDRLVYFELFPTAEQAIAREKELKSWRRSLKTALIEIDNPTWDDLSSDWYEPDVSHDLERQKMKVRGRFPVPLPSRTVRTDFPYTALRQVSPSG